MTNLPHGSICSSNTDCHSNSCVNAVCTSLVDKIGGICNSSLDCPMGSFCDPTSATCEPTLSTGATCMNDENCNFGFSCVKDPISQISRCIQDLSVSDGNPVSVMGGIQSASVCKSYNLFFSNSKQTYYCMPANTSNMNYEIGYPSGT